jgi:ubiquinone/menaquinone biosynthesis C-methylase UbiE
MEIRRVTFAVAADDYDRLMGRYSVLLAPGFADLAGVAAGQRVLDVGCGPGALTAELVGRESRRGARVSESSGDSDDRLARMDHQRKACRQS